MKRALKSILDPRFHIDEDRSIWPRYWVRIALQYASRRITIVQVSLKSSSSQEVSANGVQESSAVTHSAHKPALQGNVKSYTKVGESVPQASTHLTTSTSTLPSLSSKTPKPISTPGHRPLLSAMAAQERPYEPPLPSRIASTLVIGGVGFLSRSFLYLFSNTETRGLDGFLRFLDKRRDEAERQRGLITVSNHLSVYVSRNLELREVGS